ncbi:MAG: glucose-6-phosphate dehydrogenase, partial [Alphaproteobacteria bacterium]
MPQSMQPAALVIIGGTGDLAMRMLFPSLYFLDRDGFLDKELRVIGAARSTLDRDTFVETVHTRLRTHVAAEHYDESCWKRFAKRIDYVPVDGAAANGFQALAKKLGRDGKAPTEDAPPVVSYLSTAPKLYGPICEHLRAAGLAGPQDRIAVEKPIGHDLASCRALNDCMAAV